MTIAVFPGNKLGLHYASMLNGHFSVKIYGDTGSDDAQDGKLVDCAAVKCITEKNVILCQCDAALLKMAICHGKNVLYPFPLPYCVDEITGLLDQNGAYLVAGGIERHYDNRRDVFSIIHKKRIGVVGIANITRKSNESGQ